MSLALALSATRCVSDFVDAPKPPPNIGPSAARLAFTSQPSDAEAGTTIGSAVTVEVQDSTGRIVTTGNQVITVTIEGGRNGAHLRGTTTATASQGVATFSGLSVDSAAGDYRLRATSGSLADAQSARFDIAAGPAARIGFITQPGNVVAFSKIEPAVRVAIQDSLGNATVGPSRVIELTLEPTSAFGPRLMGDVTRGTGGSGIATFDDLRVTRTGTYVLHASTAGFAEVISSSFNVAEPEDVIALAIRQQPSTTAAGQPITPAIRVATVNSLGNTVTTGTYNITLSVLPFSGKAGASLRGTTTVASTGGEASFGNVAIDSAAAGYLLVASASGLSPDTTDAFDITAGAAGRLAFVVQPTTQPSGSAFTPPPKVAVLDAQGNLVPGATATVALYITAGSGPSGASLSGNTSVAASGGYAEFPGVSIATPHNGYTLTASSAGLASTVSTSFDITFVGPAPATSVIVSPSSASFASLGAFQTFTAEARDATGAPISGAPITWSSSSASVASVNGSGVVTAQGNGTATITATSGAASGAASVTVAQATASIAITTNADTIPSLGQPKTYAAEARDANGNAIPGRTISWASESPAVVTIDAGTGVASAVTNGTAVIRASADGRTTTLSQVVWQRVATVTVAPDTMTLALNESRTAQAAFADARGNAVVRAFTPSWTSEHTSATVAPDAADNTRATVTRVSTSGPNTIDVKVTVDGRTATIKVK